MSGDYKNTIIYYDNVLKEKLKTTPSKRLKQLRKLSYGFIT